jgi:nitrite reductase (NADH) small subunit
MRSNKVLAATNEPERSPNPEVSSFTRVCELADIYPGTGVAALIDGHQIAIFRPTADETLYALSNFDPFSKAFVLSRGILGDRQGKPKVSSPIYKQSFDLRTGQCFEDPNVSLTSYLVRVRQGHVEVGTKAFGRESGWQQT